MQCTVIGTTDILIVFIDCSLCPPHVCDQAVAPPTGFFQWDVSQADNDLCMFDCEEDIYHAVDHGFLLFSGDFSPVVAMLECYYGLQLDLHRLTGPEPRYVVPSDCPEPSSAVPPDRAIACLERGHSLNTKVRFDDIADVDHGATANLAIGECSGVPYDCHQQ